MNLNPLCLRSLSVMSESGATVGDTDHERSRIKRLAVNKECGLIIEQEETDE